MTNDPNKKRRSGKAKSTVAVMLALIGLGISRAESCDCNNNSAQDSANDSLLADFDYDINFDDYDFSFDYSLEYEEERLCLRVKQASFDSASGVLTAVIENYGNAAETSLPALILKTNKDAEDYICCVYPDSYYKDASNRLDAYLDYRMLILPQTEVTLKYQLESYELEYLKEAIAESDEIWVTFYKDTLEETYCILADC